MAKAIFPAVGNESTKPVSGGSPVSSDIRNALSALFQGDVSALRARAQDTADMTVNVASSSVENYFNQIHRNGEPVVFEGGDSPGITAPAEYARIDILYLNSAGNLAWVSGDEDITPLAKWSGLPDEAIAVCTVYCRTTMTKIVNFEDKDANEDDGYIYQDVRPLYMIPKETDLSDSVDDFTIKYVNSRLKLADRIEGNIMIAFFKIASNESLSKFGMIDGIVDSFEDSSGIDSGGSSNYSLNDGVVSPLKSGGGLDSYVKLLMHFNGAGEILYQGNFSSSLTVSGAYNTDKLLDKNSVTYWGDQAHQGPNQTLTYDFGVGITKVLKGYCLGSENDSYYARTFNAWTFQGSNDGSNWATLDSRSVTWSQGERKYFSFSNSTSYRYYRFSFSSIQTADEGHLSWLEFYSADAGFVDVSSSGQTVTPSNNAALMPVRLNKTAGFFDGDSDYLKIDWTPTCWNSNYTIEFEILFHETPQGYPFTHYTSDSSYLGLSISSSSIGWGGTYSLCTASGLYLVQNTWYRVRIIRNGNNYSIYLNEKLVGSSTSSTTVSPTGKVGIGALRYGENIANSHTYSWIKYFRISNTVRENEAPTLPYETDANTLLLLNFDAPEDLNNPLGSSAYFDGTSDCWLSVPDHADWDFGTGAFTIEGFFKWDGAAGGTCMVDIGSGGTGTGIRMSIYDGGGTAGFHTYLNTTEYQGLGFTPIPGMWYHFATCRDSSGNLRMFINGVQSNATATGTNSKNITGTLLVKIGEVGGGGANCKGWMRELRISNTARYTSNFIPPTTAFVSDSNTKLLMHFEGTPNDTNGNIFSDDGNTGHTVTRNADVVCRFTEDYRNRIIIDESANGYSVVCVGTSKLDWVSVFGDGVYKGFSNSDYLTIPGGSDFQFGTGNFSIDCWYKPLETATEHFLVSNYDSGGVSWTIRKTSTNYIQVYIVDTNYTTTLPLIFGEWYHIEVCRAGTGTNQLHIFINGSLVYSGTCAIDIQASSNVTIGNETYSARRYGLKGCMDELRISKGIARHTASFTPLTSEYDEGTPENMELKSAQFPAEENPDTVRIVMQEEDVESIALNTDLKAYVSRDDGATWEDMDLSDEGDYGTGKRILHAVADVSGQGADNNVRYKLTTHNNKDVKLHGVSLAWD
ncbi:MAG: LamG-like jellyroll fold domain-containing protein [Candidatus Omnitrophota bacterium]